ncbi:MAG: transcription antitermination factor NusB [Geminicoccaceae bacterium]
MTPRGRPKPVLNKRRAARFAAVQALYQLEVGGGRAHDVVAEFDTHRLAQLFEPLEVEAPSPAVDRTWFALLVEGAWDKRQPIDTALETCLSQGWTVARLGSLLRACLRAGAYEITERTDVPVKAAINEYVELAHLFLPSDEASFVNAVLDRLAQQKPRPEEAAL